MDGWSAPTEPRPSRLPLDVAFFGERLPFGFVGTISATFWNVRPPSVESAMGTLPLVVNRYTIHRLPNESHASCWSQQISPSWSPAPMICLVQVRPPSNETPSNNPTTPTGRTDIATMFEGFVGLTAMASSASFPARALTLMFAGACGAAPAGMPNETSRARTRNHVELVIVRTVRLRMTPSSL